MTLSKLDLNTVVLMQVLKFFPLYEDDADDSTWHRISKRLRPFVDKLLRLGLAHLWGLRLDADILAYPELLGQLPLRHLELEVGRSSKARLSEIMSALSQCSTLEHLSIQRPKTDCSPRPLGLHDLCLCKAPKLTLVHLQRCFPEGNFSLPAGCQLRLHLKDSPDSWDQTLQSENGKRLMECTSTLSLYYLSYHRPLPSHIQDFRALQYLKLEGSPQPKDLAILQGIPHVRVRVHGSLDTLFLTAGSWQSLEVYVYGGFEINFTDIDAFVRDNRRYLFVTSKATKAWRNMSTAMHAASQRQCVGYFTYKSADGTFHKRLSSIKGIAKDLFAHAISFDDFWPKVDMQSCLPSPTPKPIDKESALGKDLPKLQIAKNGRPPGHLTLRGSLAWLANRLKPIRNCIRCGKCVVVVAPEEAS